MTDYEKVVLRRICCLSRSSEHFSKDPFASSVLITIDEVLTELLENAEYIVEFSREADPSAKITVETLYDITNPKTKRKKK